MILRIAILIGLVLGAALLLMSCDSRATSEAAPASGTEETSAVPISVTVAKPGRRDISDRITLAGSIVPDAQVTLYAKVTGYLKTLSVDIGDRVREGQLLAEIEVPEMTAGLAEKRAVLLRAEAEVEQAQASVAQFQAEREFEEVNFKRLSAIRERDADVLPQQDVDQARAAFSVAESRLSMAEATVHVAEAAVATARAELETFVRLMDYARIAAPLNGVVTERFVDPGALVQAAVSSRTQAAPLVSLARLDRVRLVVDVPERSAPHVGRGTAANVRIESLAGEDRKARVSRTSTVLDPATRTMRVEFDLSNPRFRLRPGMTARVEIELRRFEGALTVPVTAISGQAGNTTVFVVSGGVAHRRSVETGLESPGWVQVLKGLSDSDEVVVSSGIPLSGGAQIVRR
ncbi:MAG: efflux RND transporter periplasmic adaptor subunit [Bryobacterales bacterium]|nr:efflux RND transporter periplasmic adaptor subunit [Bryobacterales bacterium]